MIYRVTVKKDNDDNPGVQDYWTEKVEADHPVEAQHQVLSNCFRQLGWRVSTAHVPVEVPSQG